MDGEPSYWFALAAEDKAHHAAVTRLTDRVLEAHVEWFTPATRDAVRRWRPLSPTDPYWKVANASAAARKLGLPLRGDFSGQPAKLEASMYRAQLLLWQHAHVHGQRIDAGFIARDTDRKPRKDGAQQAAESGAWPFHVVLAFPHPESEAWPIAVFEPVTGDDHARVRAEARRLGYSPVERPERLTSNVSGAAGDTKAVLDALTANSAGTGDEWLDADLDVLRARGQACGLSDFLEEVEAKVVPLLDPSAGTARGA
jgi:hypothetical protein